MAGYFAGQMATQTVSDAEKPDGHFLRHEHEVEEEIDMLRDGNRRQSLSRQQIENALAQIEGDLEHPVSPTRKRRTNKRGR